MYSFVLLFLILALLAVGAGLVWIGLVFGVSRSIAVILILLLAAIAFAKKP